MLILLETINTPAAKNLACNNTSTIEIYNLSRRQEKQPPAAASTSYSTIDWFPLLRPASPA
jgi:hypothetical protein